MAKAETATHARPRRCFAKRISDHVAIALVVYTLALIFITSPAMHSEGTSILPYFALVGFVAMVIPACRNMERRWQVYEKQGSGEGSLDTRFTADRIKLWTAAIAIPILLAILFTIF